METIQQEHINWALRKFEFKVKHTAKEKSHLEYLKNEACEKIGRKMLEDGIIRVTEFESDEFGKELRFDVYGMNPKNMQILVNQLQERVNKISDEFKEVNIVDIIKNMQQELNRFRYQQENP